MPPVNLAYRFLDTMLNFPLFFFRHVYLTDLHPDYLFLMSFIRCQLTVTITLLLVFGPKASRSQKSLFIASSKIVEGLLTANWTKYAFYCDQRTSKSAVWIAVNISARFACCKFLVIKTKMCTFSLFINCLSNQMVLLK